MRMDEHALWREVAYISQLHAETENDGSPLQNIDHGSAAQAWIHTSRHSQSAQMQKWTQMILYLHWLEWYSLCSHTLFNY